MKNKDNINKSTVESNIDDMKDLVDRLLEEKQYIIYFVATDGNLIHHIEAANGGMYGSIACNMVMMVVNGVAKQLNTSSEELLDELLRVEREKV